MKLEKSKTFTYNDLTFARVKHIRKPGPMNLLKYNQSYCDPYHMYENKRYLVKVLDFCLIKYS